MGAIAAIIAINNCTLENNHINWDTPNLNKIIVCDIFNLKLMPKSS